jgi:tetratricopeptide (TPR) repeat protein
LYDLDRDPGERQNLVDQEPARARSLRNGIEQRLRREQAAARQPGTRNAAVPPELLEQLGALGYVSPGTSSTRRASGADPKDKIEEYKIVNTLMREGLINLREGRYAASLARFELLFERGIDSFETHYYAARALGGLKRWRQAAAHYEGAIKNLPTYIAAYLGLADTHLSDGKPTLALEAIRRGLKAVPDDPRLIEREGDIGRQVGDTALAVRSYERVGQLAPRDSLVRVKLGELYRDIGQPVAAARLLREAIALDPAPSYWNSLGMILGGSGELLSAEQAFREAVARDRSNAQYVYNLGLALARQSKRAEAVAQFQQTLALDPRFTAARQRIAELR